MPSAADALLPRTTTGDPAKNDALGSPPSNAAGAEIPVTLHASRYSASSKGAGKLPPVHEETRTVIIFPQGAVVRLSAIVTPGELVVLTNNRTGADVICRVTTVKTQPGIQNYVHLEFTQRALDFWEETPATGRLSSIGKPPAATASPTLTPAVSIASTPEPRRSPLTQKPTVSGTSAPTAEANSAPTAPVRITSLAEAPTAETVRSLERTPAAPSQVSEIAPSSGSAHKQAQILPSSSQRLERFELTIPQKRSKSKTVLFAIAAAVVLAVGAIGGVLLLRGDHAFNVAQQLLSARVSTTPAPAPLVPQSGAPITDPAGEANSLEARPSASVDNSLAETPAQPAPVPSPEPPKVEAQLRPIVRPNINVGKISPPKLKRAAQLNSSEPPPLVPPEANALPATGEIIVNTTARSAPLPPEAVAPAALRGGQLQQPKLLSSVAAVYPSVARAQRVQGDVVIDALIDVTGKVSATSVVTGNPLLQKAAVDSLRLWKYQPARLNGEPIPIHINVTLVFHLN
jgi:protein TonB